MPKLDVRALAKAAVGYVRQNPDEILKAATQPIDGPRGHQIELLASDCAKQGIELGAILPTFGAANPVIDVFDRNRPPVSLGRRL